MIGSVRSVRRTVVPALFVAALTTIGLLSTPAARAVSCSVSQAQRFPETQLLEADAAINAGKADDALQIYKKALLTNPAKPALHAALAQAYLDQFKSDDAEAELKTAIAAHPHSAVLETVLSETELQQGKPWDAQDTINRALTDDPCYPEAHRIEGRLMEVISMYGSAVQQYSLAYRLAPHDIDALYSYLPTFIPSQRVAMAQSFLEHEKLDPESQKKLQQYIKQQKVDADAVADCALASSSPSSATIPLLPLMTNGKHMRAIGLDVHIDGHSTHLDVDTASDGLTLSPAAAARAGLQYQSDAEFHAIGGDNTVKGQRAIAKSLKIGPLEFHNCPVTVYDRGLLHSATGRVLDESYDGEIPMALLRQFLITLDLPRGELKLAPLPPYPNAAAAPLVLSESPQEWHDRYIAPEMSTYALAYQLGWGLAVPTRITDSKKQEVLLFVPETTAAHTALTTDVARGIRKLQRDQYHETYGLAGTENNQYSVGSVNLEFAHVGLAAGDTLAIDSKELGNVPGQNIMKLSGIIGANALRQCVIHLDYRDALIKLDYTPGPSRFFGIE